MSTKAFTSHDVIDITGITPIQLNALVHRKLYGIKASISGPGRKVRIFDENDVYAIALVWGFFESGLRTQQIRAILKEFSNDRTVDAKYTAQALLEDPQSDYIVIIRQPRRRIRKAKPEEWVGTAHRYDLEEIVVKHPTATILVIPIGSKFADVRDRIEDL